MAKMSKIRDLKDVLIKVLSSRDITHGLARACRRLQKEIVLYENHVKGKDELAKLELKFQTRKVQIGGGSHVLAGYLNIDICPPADVVFDIREYIPLQDSTVDHIFSEHFLEHIDYPVSVKKFVSECYRVLKQGGELILGVPDGELILNKYVERDVDFYKKMISKWYSKRSCLGDFNTYIDLVNYHFRDQDDDDIYTPHLWTYDFEKMEFLLKSVGFKTVGLWNFDETIANPKREWASLYVIAKK
ncbi:glycosyltransferase [Candidatus Shapirobacteria bacterium]|nr:MAG: glycosyltransferase [Candidatus Shapirobacteria bacterium]